MQSVVEPGQETISFDRLHGLAKRGYQVQLGPAIKDIAFSHIDLKHSRSVGDCVPPSVTLWSNDVLATNELLWPAKFVKQAEEAPSWQEFIVTSDKKSFDKFRKNIPLPSFLDLYGRPLLLNIKLFTGQLLFGISLCFVIAAAVKLLLIALNV